MFEKLKRILVKGEKVNKDAVHLVGRCQKLAVGEKRFAYLPEGEFGNCWLICTDVSEVERFARQHGCKDESIKFYAGKPEEVFGTRQYAK